ncbi:MAG: helix-turn-helix transcriptional regulator [Chloroflexi bacterium]|nr:helix-turn-helix transcriptional regulator [Chloroflexota bacterium]
MDWAAIKKELLSDPQTKREYQALAFEHELARSIIRRRLEKGLTQRQLAARAGTKQPAISRLESGASKPSLTLLERVADALDANVVVRIEPRPSRRRPTASRK